MKKQSILYSLVVVMVLALFSTALAQDSVKWFMRWDNARVEGVAQPVMEAFTAETGIEVEFENIGSSSDYYTKLTTTIAGGTAPDVFYPATHVAYRLASKGAMLTLNDLIEQDNIDLTQYDPAILDLYTIDGNIHCLPIDTAALVVYYNKGMFDAAGVDYPQAGWTWDDFLATAQALTFDENGDGRNDQFGVDNFRNYWPMVVWSNTGKGLFDDIRNPTEFIGNSEEAIASVQFVGDLIIKHNVMPTDEDRADISDLFAASKAAMAVVGHWRVPRYMAAEGVDFDVAPLPLGKTGVPVNRADGSCFGISAETKNPEAAWELVKYLAAPGALGVDILLDRQQMTPVITEYRSDPRFMEPDVLPGVDKGAFLVGESLNSMYDPIHPMYSAFDSLWKSEFGEVWNGNATAAKAMALVTTEVNEILRYIEDYE